MAGNPKCWHYDPIDPKAKLNCLNCTHWGWTRCKDEAILLHREEMELKGTEGLMRHNSYARERGAVRQVRRG